MTIGAIQIFGRNLARQASRQPVTRIMQRGIHNTPTSRQNSSPEPMIRLDESGKAPVIRYDLPGPTSYSGIFLNQLNISPSMFMVPERTYFVPDRSTTFTVDDLRSSIAETSSDTETIAPEDRPTDTLVDAPAAETPTLLLTVPNTDLTRNLPYGLAFDEFGKMQSTSGQEMSPKLEVLTRGEMEDKIKSGIAIRFHPSLFGDITYTEEPIQASAGDEAPRIFLIEDYRFSSFTGDYGAGDVINTFSLFPGEITKISIETHSTTTTTSKNASSIFDSFSKESAEDFQKSVSKEQSDKRSQSENFGYSVEASASANFGVASASVKAGVQGGSNSAREEMSKSVAKAASKHSQKASAKRQAKVNTSSEMKQETGKTELTEREIQNVNQTRTLNLVFRQMQQEYICLLHLVDLRLGFYDPISKRSIEQPISKLDDLLDSVIKDESQRPTIKYTIVQQIKAIRDHQDKHRPEILDEVTFGEGSSYLRFNKGMTSTYSTGPNGKKISVNGIIMSATTNTLKTSGIVVDAVLGQGEAIEPYSKAMQDAQVAERELTNKRSALALEIIQNNDKDRAGLFKELFGQSPQDATDT